jgi:hypothetical protein
MPSGPLIGVRLIVNSTLAVGPRSIVDLGMGTGKYGFLLREQHDLAEPSANRLRLVGVEGWPAYIGDHQRAIYDEIVTADVTEYVKGRQPDEFDVALALDIIEHFSPASGLAFLDSALTAARYVLVSTPRAFYAQIGHENPLERHQSWWPEWTLRQAGKRLGARIATHHDRLTTYAMLSRSGVPALATEHLLELTNRARTLLLPDRIYYRLRNKSGPMI